MTDDDAESLRTDHVEAVRSGFSAALEGDFDGVRRLLADDVHWYGAGGDPSDGCTDRRQALVWMGQAIARGIRAQVLDVRALDENRVLVLLERIPAAESEPDPPHAQIVTFRGGKVAEILVYPSEEAAARALAGS
ncbi:MAG TPA: nuclear transport factor 2 family protein [Solirubrobacteraceae bacterium]|nr:nuclear transport factor 2 family protein [Solirubrobacteraceae bacterium]